MCEEAIETRDVAEVLVDLASTSPTLDTLERVPLPSPQPPPRTSVVDIEEPTRKSQRVRKPTEKAAELRGDSQLQSVYAPFNTDRITAFYPTLPWHFSCLRAMFLPLFKGKVLGDLCCGQDETLRFEYEKFLPKLPVIMRDLNFGATRFDARVERLPHLDILVTSLPYSKGLCTPLLLRMAQAYPLVFVKLQLCFDRCASSDARDEVLMGGTLAWEVRMSPAKYPTFTKGNPAIESWFVFARSEELTQELDKCVDSFFANLKLREGSSVEFDCTCDLGSSAIVSVRTRTKTVKWDMRDKKQTRTSGGNT